jgi:hypothetical protein
MPLRYLRGLFAGCCLVGGLVAVYFLWTTGVPFWVRGPGQGSAPDARVCEALWADLAGEDAPRAYRALCRLAEHRSVAAPFLAGKVRPATAVAPERLARLVRDLDDEAFAVRDSAQQGLTEAGPLAAPALRQALEGRLSPEAKRRVEDVLGRIEREELDADTLRGVRAVEALERMGTPEARAVLTTLAGGAEGAVLTREARASLDRLAHHPTSRP